MFNKFRIANKELCPCNSGKQYKDCCKSKAAKTFHNNNEALHFTGQLMKKAKVVFAYMRAVPKRARILLKLMRFKKTEY